MEHHMKLLEGPFELIRSGKKVIEIRLNDEKRQKVSIDDTIVFSKIPDLKETLHVRVLELLHYRSFEKLYRDVPSNQLGYDEMPIEDLLEGTYEIYTKDDEEQYGVLGIRIEVID